MARINMSYTRSAMHKLYVDALTEDGVACNSRNRSYNEQATYDAQDTGNRGLFNIYNTRINEYQDMLCALVGEKRINITETIPAIDFLHTENSGIMATYPVDSDGVVDSSIITDIPYSRDPDVYNKILVTEDPYMINRIVAGDTLCEYVYNVDVPNFASSYNLQVSGDLGETVKEYRGICDPEKEQYITPKMYSSIPSRIHNLQYGYCMVTFTLNDTFHITKDSNGEITSPPALSSVYVSHLNSKTRKTEILTTETIGSHSRFVHGAGEVYSFALTYEDHLLIVKPKSESSLGSTNFMIYTCETSVTTGCFEAIEDNKYRDLQGNIYEVDSETGCLKNVETGNLLDPNNISSARKYIYYIIPFIGDELISGDTSEKDSLFEAISYKDKLPSSFTDSPGYRYLVDFLKTKDIVVTDASGLLLGLYSKPYEVEHYTPGDYNRVNKWELISDFADKGMPNGVLYEEGHLLGKGNFFEAPLGITDPATKEKRVTLPEGFKIAGEDVDLDDYDGISTLVYDIVEDVTKETIDSCLIPYDDWEDWTSNHTVKTSLDCVITRDDYAAPYVESVGSKPNEIMAYPQKFLGADTDLSEDVDNFIGVDPRQLDQYFQNCKPKIMKRTKNFQYPTEEFYLQFVQNKGEMEGIDTTFWKNYFDWDPSKNNTPVKGLLTGRSRLSGERDINGRVYSEVLSVPTEVTVLSLSLDSDVNCSFEVESTISLEYDFEDNWNWYRVLGKKYKSGQPSSILEKDYKKIFHAQLSVGFLGKLDADHNYDYPSLEYVRDKFNPTLKTINLDSLSILSPLEAFQKKGHNDDTVLIYPVNKAYFPEKLYLISRNDIGLEEKDSNIEDSVINPKSVVSFMNTEGQGKVISFLTTKKTEFKLSEVDYVEIKGTADISMQFRKDTWTVPKPIYGLFPCTFGDEHDCYIYELEPFSLGGVDKGLDLSGIKVVDPFGEEKNLFEGLSSLKIMPFAYPSTYFLTEKKTNALNNIVYSLSSTSQANDFLALQNSIIIPGIPKPDEGDTWAGLKCYDSVPIDSFTGLMSGVPYDLIIQKCLKSALASWPLTNGKDSYLKLESLPKMLGGLMQSVRYLLNMSGENLEISYRNSSTGMLEKRALSQTDLQNLSERTNYTQDLSYTLPGNLTRSVYTEGEETPEDSSTLENYLEGFGNEVSSVTESDNQLKLSSFLKVKIITEGMFGENEAIERSECETLDTLFGDGTFPFLSFGDVESPMESYVRAFKIQVTKILAKQIQSYNTVQENTIRESLQAAVDNATKDYTEAAEECNQHNKDTVEAYNSIYSRILNGFKLEYDEEKMEISGQLCDGVELSKWDKSFADISKIKLNKSIFMDDPNLSAKLSELRNSFSYGFLWWTVRPYAGWSNDTFWEYFDLGTSSDEIGPAGWRLLEKIRWDSVIYPGLKKILEEYIENAAAEYAEQGIEVTTMPPTIAKSDITLKLFMSDGEDYNVPLTEAFAAVGTELSQKIKFTPNFTVSQVETFLEDDVLKVFRYQKSEEETDGTTTEAAYNVYLPVMTTWKTDQYKLQIEVTDEKGEVTTVDTVLDEDPVEVEYISDITNIDGDRYFAIPDIEFTNFNDMDPALFSGLVTFMRSALEGTASSEDTGSNPGVLNTENDKGPLGRVNSLYYQRYLVLNSRLNLANGTLTKAYNMLRNAQNVEETEVYSQNNVSTFNRIMAVIPVEKMTPMTFLPAQDSQSGQVKMNSKFYYTEFMEAIRSSISDKCVLTCTHCNVKDSCPFYDEEEVLKLYVPQADSIDLWIKDNELDLLWDAEDEDIDLTANTGGGNEKHLYADTFRDLHKPYAEVVKHIGTGSQKVEEYDVNPLNDVIENLSSVGEDFETYNSDGMGWLLGGRYGTLQHNSAKSIPVEGYDSSKFPDYKYLYDALFLRDQESYIKYSKSTDAYHVALDYDGDHYEGDVHIKMPVGLKFPGGITLKDQDDLYLVSDDLVDSQGNEITPVIYLNTVENLLFYFDINTSSDTSDSAETSIESASTEITVSSVDNFDAAGNYIPAGSMSPVVSRVPRSNNDHIMYPKDVAQWCVNYAKGPCYSTPLSADDPQNKDQFWMEHLKKKCSYRGSNYWIDVAGRPRMSSGYSENMVASEDEVNPYLVISGKPMVVTYMNFVRRLSLKLEEWVMDGDPKYVSNPDQCSILWVKNPRNSAEIEKQRYTLTQMKTNLRLVLVRNG